MQRVCGTGWGRARHSKHARRDQPSWSIGFTIKATYHTNASQIDQWHQRTAHQRASRQHSEDIRGQAVWYIIGMLKCATHNTSERCELHNPQQRMGCGVRWQDTVSLSAYQHPRGTPRRYGNMISFITSAPSLCSSSLFTPSQSPERIAATRPETGVVCTGNV